MNATVLIADDEEGIRAVLVATLSDGDRYRLLLARDGIEALTIARQEKPDLILLDLLMPGMNGHEVCRTLKGDPDMAGIKVVMLTGLAQEVEQRKARAVGADDILTKPFCPTALVERIDELLAL